MSIARRGVVVSAMLGAWALVLFGCGQDNSVLPNNLTDSAYKNGILYGEAAQKGPGFYFLLPKGQANPIKVGTVLRFAKSGEAKVVATSTLESGSTSSIFVIVDKSLDPDGDGFPNRVKLVP